MSYDPDAIKMKGKTKVRSRRRTKPRSYDRVMLCKIMAVSNGSPLFAPFVDSIARNIVKMTSIGSRIF